MQLKIAFHTMGGENWTVGEIYLRNLLHALRQTCKDEVRLYLLTLDNQRSVEGNANRFGADNVINYSSPHARSPLWAVNGLSKRVLLRDVLMEKLLKEHQIDVVFGSALFFKYPKIAMLSWFPDFQHVHLPEMFSNEERLSRDQLFLQCAKITTRVILMSEAVKTDFESFAPMYAHKARVLHPISYVPQSVYEHDPDSILSLYNLPEKFIYLPNQFWKHKNHETVFKAIKVLKDRGVKVFLVCTGNPVDYRHPAYFADLCCKLSEWNIRDQIIYLGLVPHGHVFMLMRQSICVLNPSLFEGWGYTVDEARSVGKQVLLSEIPSHCEQNHPRATFFKPCDFNDLAEKLGLIWLNTEPGPDYELELKARDTVLGQIRAYGETFFLVAREALEEVRS